MPAVHLYLHLPDQQPKSVLHQLLLFLQVHTHTFMASFRPSSRIAGVCQHPYYGSRLVIRSNVHCYRNKDGRCIFATLHMLQKKGRERKSSHNRSWSAASNNLDPVWMPVASTDSNNKILAHHIRRCRMSSRCCISVDSDGGKKSGSSPVRDPVVSLRVVDSNADQADDGAPSRQYPINDFTADAAQVGAFPVAGMGGAATAAVDVSSFIGEYGSKISLNNARQHPFPGQVVSCHVLLLVHVQYDIALQSRIHARSDHSIIATQNCANKR